MIFNKNSAKVLDKKSIKVFYIFENYNFFLF